MKLYIRRILFIVFFLIFVSLGVSCNKEKTPYEVFKENYYLRYPDGYDKGYEWYEFKRESTTENFRENVKEVVSESFIGYINFDKNKLTGVTTKFIWNIEITTIKDGKIIEYITVARLLNDGDYYKNIENINYNLSTANKISEGSSNIECFKIEVQMYADFFYVDKYYPNFIYGYDSITISDDHVTFDKSYLNKYESYSEKSVYYYDEYYNFLDFFYYKNQIYNEDYKTLTSTARNKIITKHLKPIHEIDITVPKEYDEIYIYDESTTIYL